MLAIRETGEGDLPAILDIQRRAFGGAVEAELTRALLADPAAEPRLSLLALRDGVPVGHILFTSASVEGEGASPGAALLAPLGVIPEAQGRGVGAALTSGGLRRLAGAGTALVFVLGDPRYYSRFGFAPALPHGVEPPHPIPEAHADAWMVRAPQDDAPPRARGRLRCAGSLDRPELWAG